MIKSRKPLIFLPFFAFLLMLVCASASVGKTLFEEDFEKGIDKDVWNAHESWKVVDGVLDFATASGWNLGYTVKDDFTDFIMFADVKECSDGATAGFAIRVQDDQNYYMFQHSFREDPNVLWWHIFKDGNFTVEQTPIKTQPPEPDEWYRWKLIAKGYHFELYIGKSDKDLKLTGTWDDKNKTFDRGAIGFWEDGGEHGQYDNVLVTDLEGAAVDYKDSLPTIWGRIKNGY